MSSGWGITGNKGRCYDFWMDFIDCVSHCREPKDCSLLREDSKESSGYVACYRERSREIETLKDPHPPFNSIAHTF